MNPNRNGFTLVELLITVLILSIGLGTIFALVTMTADLSRQELNALKLQRFAELVFASADWSLTGEEDGVRDPWVFPVMTDSGEEEQALVTDGTAAVWPAGRPEAPLIPRIEYSMVLQTNASGTVTVALDARMQSELQWTEFEREFHPQRSLW